LTSQSKFYDEYPEDAFYYASLRIKAIFKEILHSTILESSGFKIAKFPQILDIQSGVTILKSSMEASLKMQMRNFIGERTFCILGGVYIKAVLLEPENDIVECVMSEDDLNQVKSKNS